jgi:DedD protein
MDQGLKERLVGAAVLVAIAVWLIPWVLDGPEAGLETPDSSLQLPAAEEPMPMRTQTLRLGDTPEPNVAPTAQPLAAPQSAASAEQAPAAAAPRAEAPDPETTQKQTLAAASAAAEHAAPAAAPPAPAATSPPKPAAAATGDWIVQLGSFSAETNARRLAQQAGTYGYKAEVSSHKDGGRTLYRVRVGPQATRAAADAAASALRAHGIKDARVVPAR